MDSTSANAPSAVDKSDVASMAFLTAMLRPLIWLDMRAFIARPAASSEAEFIFEPVLNFSKEDSIRALLLVREKEAFAAPMLLITVTDQSLNKLYLDIGKSNYKDIRVNYLRPMTVSTGEVTASAEIEKIGRRVIFVTGTLKDKNGKVYATANSTELIVEFPPK